MQQLDPKEFSQRWTAGDAKTIFLDCRQPEEIEIASIPGTLNIPMPEIPGRLGEIDREREIVVMCHHGMRSLRVAHFLEQQGYANVKNLAGGIDAWSARVDPKVPKY